MGSTNKAIQGRFQPQRCILARKPYSGWGWPGLIWLGRGRAKKINLAGTGAEF